MVLFGFGLFTFGLIRGWVNMDRVGNGLGYFGCGSFRFMLNLQFGSSGVWVKVGWSHFGC